MSWAAVAGAAVGVVGGAMNGHSGGQGSQTTQNTLDPRIANFLYGGGGFYGLLNRTNDIEGAQTAQGGLNPMQQAGLEMQRQTLMDPAYTQGYGQMRSLGSSMLGQGVAGNPFLSMNGPRAMPAPIQQQQMPQGVGAIGGPSGAAPSVLPMGPGFGGGMLFGPDQQRFMAGPASAAYQPIRPFVPPPAPAPQPSVPPDFQWVDTNHYEH
jgi:hypothetical protein